MQFNFLHNSFKGNWRFETNWISTLIVLVCIPLFIKLGLWQYHKAATKQAIQDQYQTSLTKKIAQLTDHLNAPEALQFQQVQVSGHYETQYQILIDNQVEDSQAGFHVVTPFKIEGTERYVLINRGWVVGAADHQALPVFDTSTATQEIKGMVWIPSSKIFTLEEKPNTAAEQNKPWTLVWQHLDMKKYHQLAPIPILDVIIKLDPTVAKDGFVRNWQMPPSKIMTNLGYAYQWFGFAFATLAIYLYTSVKRVQTKE